MVKGAPTLQTVRSAPDGLVLETWLQPISEQQWGGNRAVSWPSSEEEEMEPEEKMNFLENIGRKMKENNGMEIVVIILIIMNTHNGPWLLNTHSGPGVCIRLR